MTGVTTQTGLRRPPPSARGRHARRRPWLAITVSVALTLGLCAFVVWHTVLRQAASCANTLGPLAQEEVTRLKAFDDWLIRNHAAGYVGEVGWPGNGGDADQWNAVGNAWYQEADRLQLWVTAWSAGAGWAASYPMAVYRLSSDPSKASSAGPQASVVEAHADPGSAMRGVDLPTGSFGTIHDAAGRYSDLEPGKYGVDYYYPTGPEYKYLAKHGVRVVRLSFMWERVQPVLGGPLNTAELHRISQSVYDAQAAGIGVVLELHNYGGYWHAQQAAQYPHRLVLGSPQLPGTDLADLWRRLAAKFADTSGVIGYDLMNEPTALAGDAHVGARIWETASQQSVTAIRSTGDAKTIAVEAYGPSGPEQFTQLHPHAWINDPYGAVRYEMHQYFDSDGSGHYEHTLPYENQVAAQRAEQARKAHHTVAAQCTTA